MTNGEKIALLNDLAFKVNHLADIYEESENVIRDAIKNETLFDCLHKYYKQEPTHINDFHYYSLEQKYFLLNALKQAEECYTMEDCCVKYNGYNYLISLALMCITKIINGGS
ncbi:MAG: hypothetical protein LBC75_02535 [Fibromonadaceae bacterium]|jgi:hypothetical protein|nr:hypothetical protein [Fibromonadaceae bacterium]